MDSAAVDARIEKIVYLFSKYDGVLHIILRPFLMIFDCWWVMLTFKIVMGLVVVFSSQILHLKLTLWRFGIIFKFKHTKVAQRLFPFLMCAFSSFLSCALLGALFCFVCVFLSIKIDAPKLYLST